MLYNHSEHLETYIRTHSSPQSELLRELERQTHLKILRPRMLSGHIQGRVLSMLSKMINPKKIFEIGTFTGYSAICLAEGLQPGGSLITCDVNDEIETFARSFISRSDYADQIEYYIKDARELVSYYDEEFDLVFIDGDKRQYPEYYELILPHVKTGGFIIADNVLWNGKVVDEMQISEPYTKGVQDFNNRLRGDDRVENVIFPFRDGLTVCRKLL